jgi:pyruvate carboxylase
VACGVTGLMRSLGLRFGALDFLVTPEGEWVFLEVNPNGQRAFVEQATGLPIAAAIAGALSGRDVPA